MIRPSPGWLKQQNFKPVTVASSIKTSGKSKKDLKLLRDECERLHKRNTELRVRLAEKYPFMEHTKDITKHRALWYRIQSQKNRPSYTNIGKIKRRKYKTARGTIDPINRSNKQF